MCMSNDESHHLVVRFQQGEEGAAEAIFDRYASAVQVIHVDTFLRSKFRCGDTHNKGAHTLIVSI